MSSELHFTLHWSLQATVQSVTPLQLALQPLDPLAHCTLQLAPPSHLHDEPEHAQVAPVHWGMLVVPPLHATATLPPTATTTLAILNQSVFAIRDQWGSIANRLRETHKSHPPTQTLPAPHAPLQQSDALPQGAAVRKQLDTHTRTPCVFVAQSPAQQSDGVVQGMSGGKHAPGPGSQRWLCPSQELEQQSTFVAHPSPVRRHSVSSTTHTLLSQWLEQQSTSCAHEEPTTAHIVVTHRFASEHPSEQQSCAFSQGAPTARQ